MAKEFDDQYADKHSIVNELFIATADDNYIAARWCFHQNLNVDFFWLAVHCVEKYLKASLLLNGENVKKQSHDIVKMFPAVKALAPGETWKQLYQPLVTKRTSSRSEPMSLVNIELHRAVVTHLQ